MKRKPKHPQAARRREPQSRAEILDKMLAEVMARPATLMTVFDRAWHGSMPMDQAVAFLLTALTSGKIPNETRVGLVNAAMQALDSDFRVHDAATHALTNSPGGTA